jgi:hypothetical protein
MILRDAFHMPAQLAHSVAFHCQGVGLANAQCFSSWDKAEAFL